MPKTPKVDCVALQHKGGEAIRKATKGMTRDEEAAYWERQTQEFREQVEAARGRPAKPRRKPRQTGHSPSSGA